jgi:hypothetical protein
MDTLQTELQTTYPALQIQLLGINQRGQEPGNASATEGRNLPWLQDVDTDGNYQSDVARDLWDLRYRDLVILDGENVQVAVLNLDDYNLAESEHYATLREMLVDAAMQSQLPWQNHDDPMDVDDDGVVIPLDVLIVVNELNSEEARKLPPPVEGQPAFPYLDCSGDGFLTPLDALVIVNFLNGEAAAATGEGELDSDPGVLSGEQIAVIPDLGTQSVPREPGRNTQSVTFARPSNHVEEFRAPLDSQSPEASVGGLAENAASADSQLPLQDERLDPLSS